MQTLLSQLHLEVADNIGDSVTSYTLDGKTITATKRNQGINDANLS